MKFAKGGDVGKKERLDAILARRTEINDYLNKKYGRSRGKNKAERDEIDALAKEYHKLGEEYLELNGGYNEYAKGGKIGFKGLSEKVAKYYANKSVPSKYQTLYGKKYDKTEAKEVGDKVAAKVYRQQQSKKK